jgi:hypothetical protein
VTAVEDADPQIPPVAAKCRACGTTAPGPLPPRWVMFYVGANPAKTRDGQAVKIVGPYCNAACAAAGLRSGGFRAGIRPGQRPNSPGRGDLARLMTQPPGGRASC